MDTQNTIIETTPQFEFSKGSVVIYGTHGKCTVTGIESRQIGQENLTFYKLEILKSPLSRSARKEPAIWVPANAARDRGMRAPISIEGIEEVKAVFSNREYYFSLQETWTTIQPKLETTMRTEGYIGLAKVVSYLFVLNRKHMLVPGPEAVKMQETVNRLLFKEIADIIGIFPKEVEVQMNKLMRHKLLPNH